MPASITSMSSSPSTSIHVCGTRDRAANARSAIASAEYCEPTIRTARAPSPMRKRSRRAKKAEKIVSATSGLMAMTRRNSSTGMTRMRPALRTRAVRNRRCPVSMFSSPRNWPAPQVASTASLSRSGRTMSTSPSRMTMKSYDGSPARNRMSPASTGRSVAERRQLGECRRTQRPARRLRGSASPDWLATRSKLAKPTWSCGDLRRGAVRDPGASAPKGAVHAPSGAARVTAPAPNWERTSSSATSSAGSR